jgi:hypothetical protein
MKFEVGKFYKHTSGVCVAIRAKIKTTMWGETLVGESTEDVYGLVPVGVDEESAVNFDEITEEEWEKIFKQE